MESRASGRLVTWFDWGEYALWNMSPLLRVSLDGRRETIYSESVLTRYAEMVAATPDGLAYLRDLDPAYVWLPAALGGVSSWLQTHGYRIDLTTPRSFVAVRNDQPVLHLSDAPLTACFPGP